MQPSDLSWISHSAEFLRMWNGAAEDIGDRLRAFHAVPSTPAGAVYHPVVTYGHAGRDLHGLLYARDDPDERAPAVVLLHGGGWAAGHPMSYMRMAHGLAARGYVALSIEYRFSSEALWPAALEDAKCAVRWLRMHTKTLGVDPARIGVTGGSAGGHLAAMVALTPGRFEGDGGSGAQSSAVQAAVLASPMTDLRAPGAIDAIHTPIKAFLGDLTDELIAEASPASYVSPASPPILSIAGDADRATPIGMIRDFHLLLDEHGISNRLAVLPGRDHAFGQLPPDWDTCFEWTAGFLDDTLRA